MNLIDLLTSKTTMKIYIFTIIDLVPSHYVPPKIPKYDERVNLGKHLNRYKIYMSQRGSIPAVKCRAFHLTLSGVTEIWYSSLSSRTIRSWPVFQNMFLKLFSVKKGWRDYYRTSLGYKTATRRDIEEFFLACFLDEKTYCVKVTNREVLSTL